MGGLWSKDDADNTETLLSSFSFLLLGNDLHNDNSLLMDNENKSIDVHSTVSKEPAAALDIYVDLPIELEHGANHIYDDGLEISNHVLAVCEDPSPYAEAMSSPQKEQWKEAMEAEYDSLIYNGTWVLTDLPSNRTPIKSCSCELNMAFLQSFVMVFLVASTMCRGVLATTITAVNNCGAGGSLEFTATSANGMNLAPGQSSGPIDVPNGWSGRVSLNPSPSTLAEFTIVTDNHNTFDISLVDGFNVALGISYTGGNCIRNGQAASSNVACQISIDQCPPNYRQGERCVSPNRDAQTDYSNTVKGICPDAYSWSKDDPTSTFTCDVGGDFTVTFCP
ncbi:hypothetical protein L7F22_033548 [Adiantum nelumboides]|nr:hypothetical protein [Adiantum nelumboides]